MEIRLTFTAGSTYTIDVKGAVDMADALLTAATQARTEGWRAPIMRYEARINGKWELVRGSVPTGPLTDIHGALAADERGAA